MENLKRFYFNLITGFATLTHKKTESGQIEDNASASNRVSREVLHYRTHFFNL